MDAFLDDRPLVAGVNENWDDINTYEQVQRPGSDISPITMRTMHHLPQIFFDTSRPERPDLPSTDPEHFLYGARPINSSRSVQLCTLWSPDQGLHASRTG